MWELGGARFGSASLAFLRVEAAPTASVGDASLAAGTVAFRLRVEGGNGVGAEAGAGSAGGESSMADELWASLAEERVTLGGMSMGC